MNSVREPLENEDGAGVGQIHSRVLAYREMHDRMASFEGAAERGCVDVARVARPAVETQVDVLHVVAEREHAGRVGPYAAKDDAPHRRGQSRVAGEGVEGAGGLERRGEVEGVVEEGRGDAEELAGDEEGCDAGAGAVGGEGEGKDAREELFRKRVHSRAEQTDTTPYIHM